MKNQNALILVAMTVLSVLARAEGINQSDGQKVLVSTRIYTCYNYQYREDCYSSCPDPSTCSSIECVTTPLGPVTSGSRIDNVSFNHIHEAWDLLPLSNGGGGCSTCGGASTPRGNTPAVVLQRFHRFRDITEQGSFSPGIFMTYDINLKLQKNGNANRIRFFDPRNTYPILLDDGLNFRGNGDVLDGNYVDSLTNKVSNLQLRDGIAGAGNLVTNFSNARSAVVTTKVGERFYFEIIDLGVPAGDPVAGATPWKFVDLGQVNSTGWAAVNSGVFTVKSSGEDIWNSGDEGTYAYQALRGDGALVARVTGLSQTDGWAKAGVMIRESLAANSKYAYMLLSAANGTAFQRRTNTNGSATHTAGPGGGTPVWVKIERSGNTINGYQSTDGTTWNFVGSDTVAMGQDVFIGLAGTAHHDGLLSTSTYDNVSLTGTPTPAGQWPSGGVSDQLSGRLSRIEDRNGYGIDLTYKFNPSWHPLTTPAQQTAISSAPDLQWQIDTVKDSHNRQISFQYLATQVSGHWVISQATLPNEQTIAYQYANGTLSNVNLPDGTVSTFSTSVDNTTNTTVVSYDDAASDGTHRRKKAYLTNNFSYMMDGFIDAFPAVWNAPSMLCRMITNGNGEVTYLNAFDGNSPFHWLVYEGGNKLFEFANGRQRRYLKDGWSLNADLGFAGFQGPLEDTYYVENSLGNDDNYYLGYMRHRAATIGDEHGVTCSYEYNLVDLISKKIYPDATTEEYTYNQFDQLTRVKDRLNRVTKMTYDARGNMLTKETGILFNGANDVNQPEHATWTWEYYPTGHQNQYLLKTAFDALYNPGQSDLHRTDYAYNAQQFLTSITEGADITGGVRAITTYEYDSAGRIQRIKAPPAGFGLPTRDVAYAYDGRDRVTVITHETDIPSATSETMVYGTGTNANLLVQKTDRLGRIEKWEYDLSGRQAKHIQAFGLLEQVEKTSTYLMGTSLKSACVDRGDKMEYTYDYRHRTKSTSQHPNMFTTLTSTNTYSKNLLFSTQDPYGRKSYNGYRSSDSALIRTIQGTMPSFSLTDINAVLAQSRDLGNNAAFLIIDYELDAGGQTTAMVDPRNIRHTNGYDSRGRLVQHIEAESIAGVATTVQGKTEYDYDAQGNQIRARNPRHFTEAGGFITEMLYNGRNLLSSKTEAKTRAEEATETYSYTPHRQIYLRTDARGNVWETGYHKCCGYQRIDIEPAADVDGNSGTPDTKAVFESNKDSYGHTTHQYVISDANTLLVPADPTNTISEATTRLDGLYRPSARTRWLIELSNVNKNDVPIAGDHGTNVADGLTTKYRYDENLTDGVGIDADYSLQLSQLGAGFFGAGTDGFAVEVTNPNNEKNVTLYDGVGRVVLTIDGNGNTNRMTYDIVTGSGLLETVAYDGLNHANKQRADGAGRIRETVDAENFVSTREYDANGNVVKSRDPNAVGQDFVYDARNRDTQCTDTHNDTTKKAFDANSNLVKTTDALNHDTVCVFDPRDRKVLCTDRIGGTTAWQYDKNNNLTQLTDAEGQISKWIYDVRNLAVEERLPDNLPKYSLFDAAHRQIKRIDQAGDLTGYMYDRVDRLITRSFPDNLNDTFTYDPASRLLNAVSARYSNTVSRTWDSAGRMLSESLLIDSATFVVSSSYDAANRRTGILYPSGAVITRSYTDRNELHNVKWNGEDIITSVYDNGKRLATTTYGNGLVETRTYQTNNLLTTLVTPGVSNFTYTWDANKRKLSENDTNIPGNVQNYTYDDDDRLNSFLRSNGQFQNWNLSLVGDWTSFNDNGALENRTHGTVHQLNQINSTPLVYDLKGNLTQNSNGQTYQWDFENKMTKAVIGADTATYGFDALGRRVKRVSNGITTIGVWDEQQEIADYNNSVLGREYVYSTYVDEPVLLVSNGLKSYNHTNGFYNIVALSNPSGSAVERYKYTPYGKAVILAADGITVRSSSALKNPWLFAGRRFDDETGLYYYRTRVFDPMLGRFLSRNPWGYIHQFPSLYDYASDDPVNNVEPFSPALAAPWLAGLAADGLAALGAGTATVYIIDKVWDAIKSMPTITLPPASAPYDWSVAPSHPGAAAARLYYDTYYNRESRFYQGANSTVQPNEEIEETSRAKEMRKRKEEADARDWVCCEFHHIATRYGEWGNKFRRLFSSVGMNIEDFPNLCLVCDVGDNRKHAGPHPQEYHQAVYELVNAIVTNKSRSKDERKSDLQTVAAGLCAFMNVPGNQWRNWVTRPK